MRKHVTLLSILSVSFSVTAGCGGYLDLEPDDPPPPPDAAPPDAGPGYPPLPPPQAFPDEPVVTIPGEAPAPPPGDVAEGVHLVFPPPVSMTTARHVTVRGTARLAGGVTAVRVNGVDARLSAPGPDGAVGWHADVQVTGGVSELVVSGIDGNGATTAATAASITFSPDMRVRPYAMALDVGHDRLLVSDKLQGLVAIDLATGTPASVRVAGTADGPLTLFSLSAVPATGRAVAIFQQTNCYDDARQEVSGVVSIDLRDGATTIVDEFERYSDCESGGPSPLDHEHPVVLHAGGERYSYAVSACDDPGDCRAVIRRRQLGDGPPLDDVPLCESRRCWTIDMRADQAGSGALVLVRDGVSTRPADTSYEVRAIDPITGTQTPLVTMQTEWDGTRYLPESMVLDAAGDRLFVLARSVNAGSVSPRLSVIGIDLATGAQSLLLADIALVDGDEAWHSGDAHYDPRRGRLILSNHDHGLIALDLATGATSVLFRPSIGEGPIPSCTANGTCEVSNIDPVRQRFFVYVPTADYGQGDIHVVDLTTGTRRLLSPGGDSIEFDTEPRLLADDVEDRLLVVHENRSLYSVDGTTGERTYVGVVPVFDRGSVAWDAARNRILYVAGTQAGGRELRAFHVDTREDRVISSDTVGSGPLLRPADGFPPRADELIVTLDASGTRAFVSQIYGRTLFGVDLATGDRTSHAVGEPPAQHVESAGAQPVLADVRRNRFLVAEYPRYAIGAIDLATGTAGMFIDYYRTDLPPWRTVALSPDHASDRALVVDDQGSVHLLDLQTGQRVLVLPSRF